MIDRPQVEAVLFHLIEHAELLGAVETVGRRARVGVRHRESLGRHALDGSDEAAALVGELTEPLLHDLLVEDTVQLSHSTLPEGRRTDAPAPVAGANATSGSVIPGAGRTRRCDPAVRPSPRRYAMRRPHRRAGPRPGRRDRGMRAAARRWFGRPPVRAVREGWSPPSRSS